MGNIIVHTEEGHSPWMSVDFKYDVDKKTASAVWTCSKGYFRYYSFLFYIRFRRKVNGAWKYTQYKIGGMEGTGNNIWYSGSAAKVIDYGQNTQVAFCIYCSAEEDGGSCDSDWGSSTPTKVYGYVDLFNPSKDPSIYLDTSDRCIIGEKTATTRTKYTDKLIIQWKLPASDTSDGVTKLACSLYNSAGDTLIEELYTAAKPQTFSARKSGSITFKNGPEVSKTYLVRLAVATEHEDIKKAWEDPVERKFSTAEEHPDVTFSNAICDGTTATISYRSRGVIRSSVKLLNLSYQLYDESTKKVIATKAILEDNDDTSAVAYRGTFTVSGLTPGHKYTVTPTNVTTLRDEKSANSVTGVTFSTAVPPQISTINNSGTDLIFGEPNGDPSVKVAITGTADAYDITLKLGTGVSSNVATGVFYTNTSAKVGTNTCKLTDAMLDTIYKTMKTDSTTTIYASIEYSLKGGATGGSGKDSKSAVMTLKGNAKTCKVGVSNNIRRAKAWVGVSNKPRRAVFWAGVSNKPRRTL